jgi:hypothetical protein
MRTDQSADRTPFRRKRGLPISLLAATTLLPTALSAATMSFEPSADTTLYQPNAGDPENANSRGEFLFVGRASGGLRRRALLRFDLSALPSGARLRSAEVSLSLNRVPPGASAPVTAALNRVGTGWGEGSSDAGFPGGDGIAATAGDPTWTLRAFPGQPWSTAGGDFAPVASASTAVDLEARYTWASTPSLVADVQSWLQDPSTNFGWTLVADEAVSPPTARRFASREAADLATRPQLLIDYELPALPVPALGRWALALFTLLLLGMASLRLQQWCRLRLR